MHGTSAVARSPNDLAVAGPDDPVEELRGVGVLASRRRRSDGESVRHLPGQVDARSERISAVSSIRWNPRRLWNVELDQQSHVRESPPSILDPAGFDLALEPSGGRTPSRQPRSRHDCAGEGGAAETTETGVTPAGEEDESQEKRHAASQDRMPSSEPGQSVHPHRPKSASRWTADDRQHKPSGSRLEIATRSKLVPRSTPESRGGADHPSPTRSCAFDHRTSQRGTTLAECSEIADVATAFDQRHRGPMRVSRKLSPHQRTRHRPTRTSLTLTSWFSTVRQSRWRHRRTK